MILDIQIKYVESVIKILKVDKIFPDIHVHMTTFKPKLNENPEYDGKGAAL